MSFIWNFSAYGGISEFLHTFQLSLELSCLPLQPAQHPSWRTWRSSPWNTLNPGLMRISSENRHAFRESWVLWPRRERPSGAPTSPFKKPISSRFLTDAKYHLLFSLVFQGLFQGLQLCWGGLNRWNPSCALLCQILKQLADMENSTISLRFLILENSYSHLECSLY